MGVLTTDELLEAIKAINDLNAYVINDTNMENTVKLDKLTDLIEFKLKLEKLYENSTINNFG